MGNFSIYNIVDDMASKYIEWNTEELNGRTKILQTVRFFCNTLLPEIDRIRPKKNLNGTISIFEDHDEQVCPDFLYSVTMYQGHCTLIQAHWEDKERQMESTFYTTIKMLIQ